jgi:uncharacterized protein (DUF1330 family)
MSAYMVFVREKTLDPFEMAIYSKNAPASTKGHPVKFLATYGPQEVLEGAAPEGVLIAEFPDVAAARVWYNSAAYQEVREHRMKGADYRVILVEGA